MQHNSSSFGVLFTKFSTNFSFVFFQETVLESSYAVWKGEQQKNKQTNNNRLVKIIFLSKTIENIVYTSISRRRIFFYSSSK